MSPLTYFQLSRFRLFLNYFNAGPRKRGEGCDDEDQGIVAAEEAHAGAARIKVTLLAAGFIIGKFVNAGR